MRKSIAFFILIALLSCNSNKKEETFKFPFYNYNLPTEQRIDDLISRLTVDEKIEMLMSSNPEITRLDIKPFGWGGECMHGIARRGKATVFPHSIGLAATFDDDLMFRLADAISDEAYAKKNAVDKLNNYKFEKGITFFSPNINIFRDPRWGRGQETYGEDPFLTSRMAVSFVNGLQGTNSKYLKVAACAKHFFAHSGPEKDRGLVNVKPSLKDMNETYLPAFKALIQEADVQQVMAAYNFINDTPCAASPYVLIEVLRKQLNFKYLVMSDGGALEWIHGIQKFTNNAKETSVAALNAGLDLNLGRVFDSLKIAFKEGLVQEKQIDIALRRGLEIKFKLGVFDPDNFNPYNSIPVSKLNCEKHKKLALESAEKSIVMLKNNNVLPLKKDLKKLYIVGNNASNIDALLGNYNGLSGDMPSILSAIINKIDAGTIAEYRPGVMLDEPSKSPADWTDASHNFDAIIAVMGITNLIEGEEGESIASSDQGDRLDLKLPANQIEYLKKQRSYGKKPIIVVLTGGSPIIDPELYELADAVLFAWYPGEQGGNAIANIIFGEVSPSGKLPITFPKSIEQLPAFADYSMKGRTYRYMNEEPLFPFGFGLTYSKFEFLNLKLSKQIINKNDSTLSISADIRNIGNVESDEVVELYIKAENDSPDDPIISLKGFKRIHLKANETKNIVFKLKNTDLMLVNNNGESILVPGKYKIYISNAAPCMRSIELGCAKPLETVLNIQ